MVIKMNYFQTLPKLIVRDKQTSQIVTNLLTRVNIISTLLQDPLIFYAYDIQDSDTPEIIAHKYYGDVNRFWMVLFANQILDPQWDWPLTGPVFDSYVNGKYTIQELSLPHHYEKIITNTTIPDGSVSLETITISEEDYNDLLESSKTYSTVTGNVNIQISKNAVDNYTYELNLNESKRKIKLINKTYASKLEVEFNKLMNT
jgi:hypothetical protein